MTSKGSVKTDMNKNNDTKETIDSPVVNADMFNKKIGHFATTIGSPITQEPKECNKNLDNTDGNMFAFPAKMTEVFITAINLESNETVGIDVVSAKVLKISVPVIIFVLIDFPNLSLSRGWFPRCLKDANVHL